MASLRRIPGRKVWIACFSDIDGKRYQRSTGTHDEKEARKIADEFEDAGRKQRTSSQVRRVIYDLHEKITGEELSDTTVQEYFDRYIESRKPEISNTTYEKYKGIGNAFLEYLGEKADRPIVFISKADITGFRDGVAKRLKTTTANGHLKIVKVFFRQAKRDGAILDNIAEDVPILRIRDKENERKPFTFEQIQKLLQKSEGELHGIILFGYYTGLRLKDICQLNWGQVDTKNQEINVETAKTGRRQILPIAEPLHAWILKQANTDDPKLPIFPTAFQSVSESGRAVAISRWFAKLLTELGLREKISHESTGKGRSSTRKTNEHSFHSLRHSLTTHLKQAGVSEAITMEIVGHNTAAMSQHYTKVDTATLKSAIQTLGGGSDAGNK